jgi:membrane peptidoglycan carboxypeptidase
MCWIFESLIKSGWELNTSCMTTVTPGYETSTWFLKKSTAPALDNAQVAAVLIDEHNGKVEVLSHQRKGNHVDINNAVSRAVKKCLETSSSPSSKRTKSPGTPANSSTNTDE